MCKVQMLRALVNQRLIAAVEDIFVVLERTIAEYEEELCRTKEENERQRQLLDAVFKDHQVVLHTADISDQHLPAEQQEWSSRMEEEEPQPPHIKEEEEEPQPLHIKEEGEHDSISQRGEHCEGLEDFPMIGVPVKHEDDEEECQSEENREVEPPSNSFTQHMITESDGDHCGGSQAHSPLAPLPDGDDATSRFPDTDDEDPKADITCNTDNTHVKCSQCGKTFTHKGNLKVHMNIHTGEKPFMCSVCGKRFFRKEHLITHTRIHTGEKPFSCSVCGKGFTRDQYLKIHMRTHTGEKPFTCSICDKSFCDRRTLVTHMRTHTGNKVFSCSVCHERFSYKYQVNNHKCAGDEAAGLRVP
ncbi:zinc finger protein 350-like [Dunckerocampus dactyliophorus]|uniref:zinc finger protein 350-like n=1 Tax=Dunckerocampus dactyliophorus TaxID=161453 RepID=UPI002405BC79|nr:zinc finger protein 350-like [Dunckerocampus dactyliophorus]